MKKVLLFLLSWCMIMPIYPISAASKVKINSTNFPDSNFRKYIKEYEDNNYDGYLSEREIKNCTQIISYNEGIISLEGIEIFTNLEYLAVAECPLKTLDVGKNKKLKNICVYGTDLETIKNINKLDLEFLTLSPKLLYNQNLDNVKSKEIWCYDHIYMAENQKFSLLKINRKWNPSNVKVVDGGKRSGNYITNFPENYQNYNIELSYKRKDGKKTKITFLAEFMTQPTISSITRKSLSSVELNWYGDPYAQYYELYRSTSKNGTYKKIKLTKKTSYVDKSCKFGKTYYYKVRSYTKNGDIKSYTKYSDINKISLKLETPFVFSQSNIADKSFKLYWDKVQYATGYQIYRSNTYDGKYTKVASTTGTSKTFKLDSKKTYYYKVRAYRKVDGKNVYSSFSIFYAG